MALLRDILRMSLSPLWNNICCTLLMLLYVKASMEGAIWIKNVLKHNRKLHAQQLVHVALSSCLMFWPLYDPSDWSWRLNVLVPAVLATRLLFKAALVRDPDDEDVLIMSRTSAPSGLLFGPLQLSLLLVWLGLTKFMSEEAAILLAAVGIGDGIAPLIGLRHGRHVYRMPFSNNKTMEGSVCGVFLGTVAGCYLYPRLLGMDEQRRPLRTVLSLGGIASVVEGTSPANMDNILVPLAMHFSIDHIDDWLAGGENPEL